jgi:hypothetical protein
MPRGSQRKVRLRLRGSRAGGCGGGGGGGASWVSRRESRTVTTSTAIALATEVVHDLRDADGLLRPLLRSAAARLAESRRLGIGRVGQQYLRLDPPLPAAGAAGTPLRTPAALPQDAGMGPRGGKLDEQGASDDIVEGEVIEEDDEDPPGTAAAGEADAAASVCLPQPQTLS